jgi:hypothetical protein
MSEGEVVKPNCDKPADMLVFQLRSPLLNVSVWRISYTTQQQFKNYY